MAEAMWGLHMARIDATAPLEGEFVGIGWKEMGDLSKLSPTREAFKTRFGEVFPGVKSGSIPVRAGVLYRFSCEIGVGDIIVYPSKADRRIYFGSVTGDYLYHPKKIDQYPHRRSVKWREGLPRSNFSQSALYEIGSAITLFQITNHAEEFRAAMDGLATGAEDVDDDTAGDVSSQVEETTEDFIIKRLKSKLSPKDFEYFVAHLLSCMGYRTRVTRQTADGGIDVIAHRDELGFEPPIIKVQCKHTLDQIGRPKVQELHGAIENGEHGLFVTLGRYSNDARTFERSKPSLRLIDGDELIELIYDCYERFSYQYKFLLPLKRSYIPGPTLPSPNDGPTASPPRSQGSK